MKARYFPEHNYRAIFHNGSTLRIAIDPNKPISKLDYPEIIDISLGDKCETGRCRYCYASGNPRGRHYTNVTKKVEGYFGPLTTNQRPFQVAIGGQQEPLEHPEFWDVIHKFRELDIVPNYTTNGVLFNEEIAEKTRMCGGVALTLHTHLKEHWQKTLELCAKFGIKPNVHIIISDKESMSLIDYAANQEIDNIVLLPYMNIGFAKRNPRSILFDQLERKIDTLYSKGVKNIAFGAGFFYWLKEKAKWDVSLYEPEVVSSYLILDDPITSHQNSYI